jgi:hypothetical protein
MDNQKGTVMRVAAGSLVLASHAGADTIGSDGRLPTAGCGPAPTGLTVTATARGRTVAAKPLRFTIVPARQTA